MIASHIYDWFFFVAIWTRHNELNNIRVSVYYFLFFFFLKNEKKKEKRKKPDRLVYTVIRMNGEGRLYNPLLPSDPFSYLFTISLL
jgi:hypothetical protein